jgi:hypothetical protein
MITHVCHSASLIVAQTIVVQCTNLAMMWDPTAKGTCWSATTLKALSYTNVCKSNLKDLGCNLILTFPAFSIATDLLFAIVIPVCNQIPFLRGLLTCVQIPMLWNVQMNRRQKTSVISILALGGFATAAALVKSGYISEYGKTGDWLWDSKNLTIWTVMECNVGIIAGNLPCLKPLFRTVLGSTYGRGSNNRTGSKPNTRTYGTGSNHRPAASDAYKSLGSIKDSGRSVSPYATYEAHILTTINTNNMGTENPRSTSAASMRDDTPRNGSAESVDLLDRKPPNFSKLGGILKTTEVSQERDGDEGLRPEPKAEYMV